MSTSATRWSQSRGPDRLDRVSATTQEATSTARPAKNVTGSAGSSPKSVILRGSIAPTATAQSATASGSSTSERESRARSARSGSPRSLPPGGGGSGWAPSSLPPGGGGVGGA